MESIPPEPHDYARNSHSNQSVSRGALTLSPAPSVRVAKNAVFLQPRRHLLHSVFELRDQYALWALATLSSACINKCNCCEVNPPLPSHWANHFKTANNRVVDDARKSKLRLLLLQSPSTLQNNQAHNGSIQLKCSTKSYHMTSLFVQESRAG